MRALLPSEVEIVEARGDLAEARLHPEEADLVARAVDSRRREFITTRHCARCALARLGEKPVSIRRGPCREPVWPQGVVGALTHCPGYRAAAVARSGRVLSLGIDAEPHQPLPEGVHDRVTTPAERRRIVELTSIAPVAWDRIWFSAKESTYKAWYPLTGARLGFEDADLQFTTDGRFAALLHPCGVVLSGRWSVQDGLIRTAVVVTSEYANSLPRRADSLTVEPTAVPAGKSEQVAEA